MSFIMPNMLLSFEISTHTVALCQLVINGQQKGLHWFIVPLRDPNSGELLPGITAGYVGPKVVYELCILMSNYI